VDIVRARIAFGAEHPGAEPGRLAARADAGLSGHRFFHARAGLDRTCEILSPGTARTDRAVKMPIYAQEGVQWLWLIDPDIRTFEVYRLFERQWRLEHTWQNDDIVQAPPFDAISLNLSDFWAPQS
jgi:hypothetical protein